MLLTGPAGVGKTAMLGVAADLASEVKVTVHTVISTEFDTPDPFISLARLLTPLRGGLGELPRNTQSALKVALRLREGPPARREVLAAATLDLLQHASRARPLLLLLDDAHWLDQASAEVIAFVARRLRGSRVGMLATVRGGTQGPLLLAGLPDRELRPLNQSEADALLRSRFPQLAAPVRARIVEEAGGLPLALLEMPMALTAAHRSGDAPLPARLPVAARLTRLFGDRIGKLPEGARAQLLMAALNGADGELSILQTASPDRDLHGVVAAEAAGLVRVRDLPPRLEFMHPLVRATVVQEAAPQQLRAAHLALAGAYPHDSAAHVWHLADASTEPQETVASLLEALAVRTLATGGVSAAMTALQRAAELSPDRMQRAKREIQAAFVGANVTGDLRRAAELLADATRLEPALTGSLAATITASYLLLNGQCEVDAAHHLLVRAIENHPGKSDPSDPHLIDALHSLMIMGSFGGRERLWEPFQRAVARLGVNVPADVDLCHRMFGDPVRHAAHGMDELDAALAGLAGELDPIRVTRLALAALYTDRLDRCRPALWRLINDGRQGEGVALAIHALISSCIDDWLTGQWDEALDLAAEGSAFGDTHGYRRYRVILKGYMEQLVRVCRGTLDDGLQAADEMAVWGSERGAGMCTTFAAHLRTLDAIALEDFEAAFAHVTAVSPPGELGRYSPHRLWMLYDVVEAAVKTSRLEAAAAHVAAMRDAELPKISSRLAMLTAGSAALVARDPHKAGALFAEALADPSTTRWPFDRARIQLDFGERLRHEHKMAEARHHLHTAHAGFEQLGAHPWLRRTERELRMAGEATPRAATEVGGHPLTAQERQVAELAASGLTNREIGERLFLSHRSVGAILYRVFPKLGVTSRAALRGALDARSDRTGHAAPAP
jgi:DNA-binding CsgD family transcriptional regulator